MTIEEAEKERGKLIETVKLSDAIGISRIDYLNGWIDCYKQSYKQEKPKQQKKEKKPLKVKDFPKKLRKEIKKEVERQGGYWIYRKDMYLHDAFRWIASEKGETYWCEIHDQHYGV